MNLEPLRALIRRFEGLRLKPYKCPAGVPTIGYGTTSGVTMETPAITPELAEELMRKDAEKFALAVIKLSPVLGLPWHNDRLCAIADFSYNLGTGRYKISTLRKKVEEGDWEEAAEQLHKWVYGGGRKLPGLVARRAAEAALL